MGFIKTQICKFAVILSLIFGANVAFAEESGGFLGLGVGYSDLNLTVNAEVTEIATGTTTSGKTESKGDGVAYGLIIGYKQLFNQYVGLRYYVNVDAMHSNNNKYNGVKFGELIFLNYNANMDLLVNFLGNKDNDFGLFLGFGLGANTLLGKGAKDMVDGFKAKYPNDNLETTSFGAVLNTGLRATIAQSHGIEVIAKVVTPVKMLDKTLSGVGQKRNTKITIGPTYQILARYVWNF